jgi:CheY-like chemotaxis protein
MTAQKDLGLVMGDPVRLHQIMWNLLSNAIKFTPMDGTIEVSIRQVDLNLEIQVKDNGQGIDSSFLPYVFDRFRQQDSSIRRSHGGLGLGLSIVRYLVELHGGKITAASEGRGKGATFTVLLPAIKKTSQEEWQQQQPKLATDREALPNPQKSPANVYLLKRLENIKILVIDDSIDSLMLADIILRRNGAIVTKAESAAEGFKILTSTQPDLIVCDISMPEEDGYSFMKRWRAYEAEHQRPMIPSAALTAFTRENERKEVFSSGFQAHLTKPIDESALVSSLVGLAGKTKSITYTNSTK